jgi:hypothetical protein
MKIRRLDWLVAALGLTLAAGCGDATSSPKAPVVPVNTPSAPEGFPTASAFGALADYSLPEKS